MGFWGVVGERSLALAKVRSPADTKGYRSDGKMNAHPSLRLSHFRFACLRKSGNITRFSYCVRHAVSPEASFVCRPCFRILFGCLGELGSHTVAAALQGRRACHRHELSEH